MATKKNGSTLLGVLKDELHADARNVRAGRLSVEKAKVLSAMAGKLISATRTEIEYAAARKEKPEIPFLK